MNHSPIDEEVRYVSEKGMSTRYHQFKAQLHNGKDWIQVYNVLSVNYVRDFADSFGEIVYVTIQLAKPEYHGATLPAFTQRIGKRLGCRVRVVGVFAA